MNLKKSLLLTSFIFLFSLLTSVSVNANTLSTSPDLKLGDQSPFVQELQKFLNLNGFTVNPTVGQPGSLGYETNLFGALTKKALTSFQSAFNVPNTGYFGPKSKNAVAVLASKGRVLGSATNWCATGQASSIEQFGITWYFDRAYTCGQFVTGDYWVMGPVTITNITPKDDNPTDTFLDYASVARPREMHGTMINPSFVRNSDTAIQGWDSRIQLMRSDIPTYSASLNKSKSFPIAVSNNSSVMSAKSLFTDAIGDAPQLDAVAILTVLPTAPVEGSFRPPYIGTNKTISAKWNKVNLDYNLYTEKLKKLPRPANINSDISSYDFTRPLIALTDIWVGDYLFPRSHDYPNYGREISEKTGEAVLHLNLDYSDAQKEKLLIDLVQRGIDVYGISAVGGGWVGDGGHNSGKKMPMMLAGLVLNDSTILARANNYFAEDEQHFYVSQLDVDTPRLPNLGLEPYPTSTIGMPEWGPGGFYGNRAAGYNWDRDYRDVNGPGTVANALAGRIMGMQTAWNWPSFFDYADRYYGIESPQSADRSNEIKPFVKAMWETYRSSFGTSTLPTTVTLTTSTNGTGVGTISGNSIVYAPNSTVNLTAIVGTNSTFAGWSGACTGTSLGCTFTITASTTVTATFNAVTSSNKTLSTPATNGTITKKVNGIATTSSTFLANTVVELTATPATNYTFGSWNGCTPTSIPNVCNVTVDIDKTVTATFNAASQTTFSLSTGSTNGFIVASPNQLSYTNGTVVRLTAYPDSGYQFSSWTECISSTNVCTMTTDPNKSVTMDANKGVTANFTPVSATTYTLTASSTNGTITKKVNGVTTTATSFNSGTVVELTATPNANYTFTGWTGCTSTTNVCNITIDGPKTVSATFSPTIVIPGDTDQDGILDTVDKCPNTPSTLKSVVNIYGCPKPKTLKLSIVSDVQNTDIKNIPTFTVKDLAGIYGKIAYKQNLNIFGTFPDTAQVDLDQYIQIVQGKVTVNSTLAPQFNKPATITLYNIKLTKPQLRVNGTMCGTCTNAVYNSTTKTYTFDVSGFSTYEVVDEADTSTTTDTTTTTNTTRSGGGGGGGGGGSSVTTNTIPTLSTPDAIAQLRKELVKQLISLMQQLLMQLVAELEAKGGGN